MLEKHHPYGTASAIAGTAALLCLGGCASRHRPPPPQFTADAPFSRTFAGVGDNVCWSVKRALLSQGYMLDRGNDGGVLTGSRDDQPQPKLNVTTRLQTSCADNRNGTSIVFVTATREVSQLQKMKQTTSLGVGPATLTMPSGSAEVLGTIRRETVKDPAFYDQFFALVKNYVNQEAVSAAAGPTTSPTGRDPGEERPGLPRSTSVAPASEDD